MYPIMAVISVLIRNFALPNPFSCFGDIGFFYNLLLAEPILHSLSYWLVGLVYEKGSHPSWGSLLYLIVYLLLDVMLYIFGIFRFAWWWILLVIVGYPLILLCILKFIGFFFGKITSRPNKGSLS